MFAWPYNHHHRHNIIHTFYLTHNTHTHTSTNGNSMMEKLPGYNFCGKALMSLLEFNFVRIIIIVVRTLYANVATCACIHSFQLARRNICIDFFIISFTVFFFHKISTAKSTLSPAAKFTWTWSFTGRRKKCLNFLFKRYLKRDINKSTCLKLLIFLSGLFLTKCPSKSGDLGYRYDD